VTAGLVTGLFSIPEGMAYANIGGFNPVAGLYAGMIPTLVGSLFAQTVLMVTTLTSAIALTSHSVLSSAGLDTNDPASIATLAVVVGVAMLALGLLRAGAIMNFVSNAVMTGFTTGIALQIIVGELSDATGYKPTGSNTLGKLGSAILHIGSWDFTTVFVTAMTVAVWALARLVKPLKALATLVALVVASLVVTIFDIGVETVGDIASIPNRLPVPVGLDWSAVPKLLSGAFAVALVALAQAAGISAAEPNPDGRRPNMSVDFSAQGVANVAGGFFGALPTGGSLSRTGVAVSAGARTRWTGVFSGLWLMAVVLVAGSTAERIPMPVIGGLILVIGVELVVGRLPDILLVVRTAPLSTVAMVVTFAATTQFPLQDAIFLGAVISMVLYCIRATQQAGLAALVRTPEGEWSLTDVPKTCPSDAITVLHYGGVGLFAEVPRLDELWPDLNGTHHAVVILSLRTLPDVPSSAVIKAFERRLRLLQTNGSTLIVAGVSPDVQRIFERSGFQSLLGANHVIPATPEVFGALNEAVERATEWLSGNASAAERSPTAPTDNPDGDA
jgi:SulP family sulfate permease